MPDVRYRLVISVDNQWASQFTPAEVDEMIMNRLDFGLGFRGDVKRLTRFAAKHQPLSERPHTLDELEALGVNNG